MLELTALPARQGDALWIRWGDEAAPHQIMIDMGTEKVGKGVRERIEALPASARKLDLLVISHVDADHIGGVLTCLAEADPLPGFVVDDVWFNGFEHLQGKTVVTSPGLEPMGPAQGERLSKWLRRQSWNKAFGGAPVTRMPGEALKTVTLHDGLTLTVIGPTPTRLTEFIDKWAEEVHKALVKGSLDPDTVSPGLEIMGSSKPPILMNDDDLLELAESSIDKDPSEANGSSIALLLKYKGRSVLLSGDAFSDDLVDGIVAASPHNRMQLDVFKLPHHGSKKNVHRKLIEAVDCDCWLISTDGTQFKHPDAEAIARIIRFSSADEPLMSFNVPSTFNGWWKKLSWRNRFGYAVEYGSTSKGLTLEFDLDA
jgi:hypothetical protein